MGRERRREREGGVRERDEESMRERDRWGSEKQMCQNCMPTMNVNTL